MLKTRLFCLKSDLYFLTIRIMIILGFTYERCNTI